MRLYFWYWVDKWRELIFLHSRDIVLHILCFYSNTTLHRCVVQSNSSGSSLSVCHGHSQSALWSSRHCQGQGHHQTTPSIVPASLPAHCSLSSQSAFLLPPQSASTTPHFTLRILLCSPLTYVLQVSHTSLLLCTFDKNMQALWPVK